MYRLMLQGNMYFTVLITALAVCAVHGASNELCERDQGGVLMCNYLPRDIPTGFSKVHIYNFMQQYTVLDVNNSFFNTTNWKHVNNLVLSDNSSNKTLRFEDKCFIGLSGLNELHMHVQLPFYLDPSALVGLNNLKALDVSECGHLSLETLTSVIEESPNLKTLEALNISRLNYLATNLVLNRFFLLPLKATCKNLKYLDVINTHIDMLRAYYIHYLTKLKVVNISSSTISDMTFWHTKDQKNYTLFKNLDLLDVSFYNWGRIGELVPKIIENFDLILIAKSEFLFRLKQLLSCQAINISGLFEANSRVVKITDCNVTVTGDVPWRVKRLIARRNNLMRLNINFYCGSHTVHSIENIDLAENNLEFLNPSVLNCMPNIMTLDLSYNRLSVMADENIFLFKDLFSSLKYLKFLSLSSNNLCDIPRNLFQRNLNLEVIDLSFNQISQVTFTISKAQKLKVLDLRYNQIKILDQYSIGILESILTEPNRTVSLSNNPISCHTCEAESFLKWLTSTKLVDISILRCVREHGESMNISGQAVKHVQKLCNRKISIIVLCCVGGFVLIIFVALDLKDYKKRKNESRRKVYRLLQKGRQGSAFEYAVFLHHSVDDQDFVRSTIVDQLNCHLKGIIGIAGSGRALVCSEQDVPFGGVMLNEIVQLAERSAVVVCVISESYCSCSDYELQIRSIILLKRPIILMLKEKVDGNAMTKTMKNVYRLAAKKIVWTETNEGYVPDITYTKICSLIIDLILKNLTVLLQKHVEPKYGAMGESRDTDTNRENV